MISILTGLALVTTLFALPAHAITTGFTAGNDFTAITFRGDLSLHCFENGASDFGNFSCVEQILDPADHSYFVTEPGDDADTVKLEATWQNGKVVEKSERFDRTTGRSKGAFNLWILTVFQRPLLNFGKNEVKFNLLKNGNIVRQGRFTATIQEGSTRTCRTDYVSSHRLEECRNPSLACANYFGRHGSCE